MVLREQLKNEAYQEYMKEKDQVDKVVQRMIDEDREMLNLIRMKQDQAKQDMKESIEAKRKKVKDEQELEEYEN